MIEAWLIHWQLFPKQLWAWLRRLGQQILAVGISILMPLTWLGTIAPAGRDKTLAVSLSPPLTNLIHLRLVNPRQQVARSEQTNRRGALAERRRHKAILPELWAETVLDSVLLPGMTLPLTESPIQPVYSTLLPSTQLLQAQVKPCFDLGKQNFSTQPAGYSKQ
jgi:hypothetical protein